MSQQLRIPLIKHFPPLRSAAENALDAAYPIRYSCQMFLIQETDEFREWLDDLKDQNAQVRIAARLRAVAAGNLGDWAPIDGPVSELRIHYGPGYRLYFARRGNVLIMLLCGGDKRSQKRDIHRASKIFDELEQNDDKA